MKEDNIEYKDNFAIWFYDTDWKTDLDLLDVMIIMEKKGYVAYLCICEARRIIFRKKEKSEPKEER